MYFITNDIVEKYFTVLKQFKENIRSSCLFSWNEKKMANAFTNKYKTIAPLRKPARILMVILVKNFQTELMVKIYSKSLVRAIGEVFLMKMS